MKYFYPHSEHWLKYLEPVEIAYVILFAYCTKNMREKTALIETFRNRKAYVIDDEEQGGTDFEIHALADGETDIDDYEYGVQINFNFTVHQTSGSSGDYYNPPEAGEAMLTDITVDDINLMTEGGDDYLSINSTNIKEQTTAFTYKDLNSLAEEASADLLEGLDDPGDYYIKKRIFSPELDEKIKGILKDHKIRIENAVLSKQYGI